MDESAKCETLTGSTMADEREPDITLNLRSGYHKHLRIITGTSTINLEIRNGKLGKVTQTEVIRT